MSVEHSLLLLAEEDNTNTVLKHSLLLLAEEDNTNTVLKHSLLLLAEEDNTNTVLKHSLLLTHGTVYGDLFALPYVAYSYLPARLRDAILASPASSDFPYIPSGTVSTLFGSLTHNEPIDMIHWDTGLGSMSPSGMFPWEQCAVLLGRL
jgi:hypothetical protein